MTNREHYINNPDSNKEHAITDFGYYIAGKMAYENMLEEDVLNEYNVWLDLPIIPHAEISDDLAIRLQKDF